MTAPSLTSPASPPDGATASTGRVRVPVTAAGLPARAAALAADGYRLALVAAHDDGATVRVVYLHTAAGDRRVELHLSVDRRDWRVPTLAAVSFTASRFERELRDLYGIQPVGHPLPRPLVRHAHWPEGWFPMRQRAGQPPPFATVDEPPALLAVEGPGVYEIPVGPVHAGLIEPGHFRFSVVGETIVRLSTRLWYTHRGVERQFEGRDLPGGIRLAERISGDTAVGHTLAYCRAVEDALCLSIPVEARRMRAILLELERVYNHIGDIGALCNDAGHGVLHAHALRIRERLLRLNARTTGHRLLRSGVVIGGAAIRQVPTGQELEDIAADIRDVVGLALGNSLVLDRLAGTAVLTGVQASDLGTLGYVARASGIATDARRDHPTGVLTPAEGVGDVLSVPTQATGDVLARFQQRAAEIDASIALLGVLVPAAAAGVVRDWPTVSHRPPGPRGTSGVGLVEGWRGTIVHRVELNDGYTVTRNKIVDPSFCNWPALPVALANTIVPDFPLANKSFNLSYAGNDL
ncbi:MAG: formate hydrogenase [Dactylosporangium sp.]|nr:NADH-quinone oxidoreductase subunit C [Dactylosporangium sp.]NNJ63396.1 formate hydrogenase [Dactylosporangium sp.]